MIFATVFFKNDAGETVSVDIKRETYSEVIAYMEDEPKGLKCTGALITNTNAA